MVQRYEQTRKLQWYKCGAAYIKTGDLRMTGEGCFYAIVSITIYISGTYA